MSKSPTPSVNSWLEDELYQQYRYDQKTVDPGWKQVFEPNGNTAKESPVTPNGTTTGTISAVPVARVQETPAVPVAPGDQMVPLRGPALRIAENMTASLTIPVATSQRVMPVKVIEENRRLINEHRSLAGTEQAFLHAPDRVGDREGDRRSAGAESGLFGAGRRIFPRHARAREPGNRGGRRR